MKQILWPLSKLPNKHSLNDFLQLIKSITPLFHWSTQKHRNHSSQLFPHHITKSFGLNVNFKFLHFSCYHYSCTNFCTVSSLVSFPFLQLSYLSLHKSQSDCLKILWWRPTASGLKPKSLPWPLRLGMTWPLLTSLILSSSSFPQSSLCCSCINLLFPEIHWSWREMKERLKKKLNLHFF